MNMRNTTTVVALVAVFVGGLAVKTVRAQGVVVAESGDDAKASTFNYEARTDSAVWRLSDKSGSLPPGAAPVPYYGGIGHWYPPRFHPSAGDFGYYPRVYGGYGYYPSSMAQTTPYRPSLPPVTHVPRLGLQYNYPFAYQMGIRVPEDVDPLQVAPNMGPYVGVVGMAKAQLAAKNDAVLRKTDADSAVPLIKQGKYREAGLFLAERFRKSENPRVPLLLSEVFFAIGKARHAELLLRHALESEEALSLLPADVAAHFPSTDDFERKVKDLATSGENKLLLAYLLIHSGNPEQGIDLLEQLSRGGDNLAGQLYRHYLPVAFKPLKG